MYFREVSLPSFLGGDMLILQQILLVGLLMGITNDGDHSSYYLVGFFSCFILFSVFFWSTSIKMKKSFLLEPI